MGLLDRLFGRKQKTSSSITITYRVGTGETLKSIAQKFYGDSAQWEKVYKPNSWKLEDAEGTIFPGTELQIPDPVYDAEGRPVQAVGS